LRQELEMYGRPREPRHEATYADFAALHHSEALAHHGHAALVKVAKWARRGMADDAEVNQLPCIAPLLHRHLRDTGQGITVLIERGCIPNHKYLGVSGHSEVILNAHPPSAICFHIQPVARR
jgi:hypothetical protein